MINEKDLVVIKNYKEVSQETEPHTFMNSFLNEEDYKGSCGNLLTAIWKVKRIYSRYGTTLMTIQHRNDIRTNMCPTWFRKINK